MLGGEDKGVVSCPSRLLTDPHPPELAVPQQGGINSRKVFEQDGLFDPSVRKGLTSVQAHPSRLVLLGNTVKFAFVRDEERVGEMPRTCEGRSSLEVLERTRPDVTDLGVEVVVFEEDPGLSIVLNKEWIGEVTSRWGDEPGRILHFRRFNKLRLFNVGKSPDVSFCLQSGNNVQNIRVA